MWKVKKDLGILILYFFRERCEGGKGKEMAWEKKEAELCWDLEMVDELNVGQFGLASWISK